MSRFWIFIFVVVLGMLLVFFLVQALHIPFLEEDTSFLLQQEKWVAALAGIGLLIADVVAPVPSSIIMFANGVLFGPVYGTLLSFAGGLGAAAVGYWMGRKGEKAIRNWTGESATLRSNSFFQKHGLIAVIVSRPIPILAETISIVAGTSSMSFKRFLFGATVGLVPAALLYAVAGTYAVDLNSGLYAFLAVIVIAGLVWVIGRMMVRTRDSDSSLHPK